MTSLAHNGRALGTASLLALALAAPASADIQLVEFLPGTFVDISATGTNIVPVNDGEFDIVTTVGNSLFPAGPARISVNGGVRFSQAGQLNGDLAPTNESLPSALAFNGSRALFPYWDDFISTNGAFIFGSIQHQEVNGVYIIQWTNVKLQSAALQDRITFQLQIPSTGGVRARFVYDDILGIANGGGSATIGYQATTAADMAQHTFNAPLGVTNGTVLSLVDFTGQALIEGPTGQFIDIAGTGTPLNLANDGQAFHNTPVRNTIVSHGLLLISSNGGIRLFGASSLLTALNAALPNGNAYGLGRGIFPFWDDIDTQGGSVGNIYVQEFPDRLVVQWDNVGFGGQPTSQRATFQVQLFDQSELLAQFIYEDVEGTRAARGGSATIGYQSDGVLQTESFSFNTPTLRNGTVLSFYSSFELGAAYCVATNNSTGSPALISARGNARVSNNNLFLRATNLPTSSTAFFIVSASTFFVANAGGSQGNLCMGGSIGRGVGGIVNAGATGIVNVIADLTAMPSSTGPFAVQAGDTLNFQCWHRDSVGGVATSNFSGGLQIQFEP
jgi:hypothetical protein